MVKGQKFKEATQAVKAVAGAALGAAAVAATGVIATQVAGAIRKGGKQLEEATPEIQRMAGNAVSKPLMPRRQKRAAATRKSRELKRKVSGRAVKRRRVKR